MSGGLKLCGATDGAGAVCDRLAEHEGDHAVRRFSTVIPRERKLVWNHRDGAWSER